MKRLVLAHAKALVVCVVAVSSVLAADSAAPQPAGVVAPAQPGPDTTGPADKIGMQGNWVKKREWLMKAHEAFGEIQELVGQIDQLRSAFVSKLNTTNDSLDTYYNALGLNEGKLTELFDDIVDYLESTRKKALANIGNPGERVDPELQAKIDIIESNVKHQRLLLDQLKLDMKSIEDLGKSLVDRVNRVDEHIGLVQGFFTEAQTIINDLWDIIDHNKAREKYYELKITILEKIKGEQTYLQTDLAQDFDAVIQTINTQITRTQEAIKKVESEGFFIKNRAQRVKELKLKEVLLKQASTAAPAPEARQEEVQKVGHELSLTQRAYQLCIDAAAWAIEKFYWLKALIFGGPTPTKALPQQNATMPAVTPIPVPTALPLPPQPSALAAAALPSPVPKS